MLVDAAKETVVLQQDHEQLLHLLFMRTAAANVIRDEVLCK